MYDPSEALLQLGLYDYVWGDPTLLQTYNSNVQADKARKEQMAYNNMWKNIELKKIAAEKKKEEAKAAAEQAKALDQEKKDKEVKLAKLYQDYNNATGEQERAYIRKQIAALNGTSPEVENEMLAAYDADREAERQAKISEDNYQKRLVNRIAQIPKIFNTDAEIEQEIDRQANADIRPEDKAKIIDELRKTKSIEQLGREAVIASNTGFTGKKNTEALELNDVLKRASKIGEYTPTPADKAIARKYGYNWDKNVRNYVRATK